MNSMKRTFQVVTVLASFLMLMFSGIAFAASVTATEVDKDLAVQHQNFSRFAESKIKQLNRNHRYAHSRMVITRQANGTYKARYHRINGSTVKAKVRRSKSKDIPYVGILSYREEILESSATDMDGFDDSLFAVVEVIPNRQIFSYQGGTWK